MKSLLKHELNVLYYIKTSIALKNISRKDLCLLVSEKDLENKNFIDYKNYNENPEKLLDFNEDSLVSFLEMRHKKSFPFNFTMFASHKESLRKTIFWWFNRNTDFDPKTVKVFSMDSLNSTQKQIISNVKENVVPGKTFIQVINAGPGTGKTTTANSLAYSLKDEGVLLISYTNESIKENYKRFFEFPNSKTICGLKKYSNKLVNLVTVDSLACTVLNESTETKFDRLIQLAIENFDPLKFAHPTRTRMYNHVIVDECQDIDDLRGNFILIFCRKLRIKSLSLFGDPRQRIRGNCGMWYSKLWDNTLDLTDDGFHKILRIPLIDTYRFVNSSMTSLVNDLSSSRPDIHVSLSSNVDKYFKEVPIEIININFLSKDSTFDALINNSGSICIIGPSVDKDNKTSKIGQSIALAFRMKGKKLYLKNEGAFVPDAIPFLTIHSVKGMEFDTVFIFGMNNYNKFFSMIPNEQIESIIFVAHTRARKKIYYIEDDFNISFVLPFGISEPYVKKNFVEIKENCEDDKKIYAENNKLYEVRSLAEDFSFNTFINENRFFVNKDNSPIVLKDFKTVCKPKKLSYKLWGFIVNFDYQCQLSTYQQVFYKHFGLLATGNYVVFTIDQIVKLIRDGSIINSVYNGKQVIHKEITDFDRSLIHTLSNIHEIKHGELLYIYDTYYNEETTMQNVDYFKAMFSDIKGYIVSVESLTKVIKRGNIEVPLRLGNLVGKADYIDTDNNVYEFKATSSSANEYPSLLQAWLYYVMLGQEKSFCYIIDLQKGIIHEISSNHNIHRWKYILNCYFTLRHHVELSIIRKNYMISKGIVKNANIPNNFYICDTEFFNGNEIFEICILNVNEPYRTIVDLLKPKSVDGLIFALDWLPNTEAEMYTSDIDAVRLNFNMAISKNKESPVLSYYICDTDVKWCPGVKTLNLGIEARIISESNGVFISGSAAPKLEELYDNLSFFQLKFQKHLTAHMALCDCLMLYELIFMGEIKNICL